MSREGQGFFLSLRPSCRPSKHLAPCLWMQCRPTAREDASLMAHNHQSSLGISPANALPVLVFGEESDSATCTVRNTEPSTECAKELVEVPGSDLETEAKDPYTVWATELPHDLGTEGETSELKFHSGRRQAVDSPRYGQNNCPETALSRRHGKRPQPCERGKVPEGTPSLHWTAALNCEQAAPQAGTYPQTASPMPSRTQFLR